MIDLEAMIAAEVKRQLAALGVAANGNERLLTVEEAADLVRVKPATIRDWIADGRLAEAGRAGRRIRVRAADVGRALAAPRPRRDRRRSPEDLAAALLRQTSAPGPDRSRRLRGRGR